MVVADAGKKGKREEKKGEREREEGRGQLTGRQTDKKEVERVARAGEEQEKNDTATNIAY